MTVLSLVMPFYRNPVQLALQYGAWLEWPDEARVQIEVVIVDDGSPEPAIDVPRPNGLPALSIYRVSEDRPWHQHAARNLGAHVANGPWLLLTDMDHVLTAKYAAALMCRLRRMDANTAYFLHRLEADTGLPMLGKNGRPKPHPNSFVMTRDLYWRAGGYDEDYCGIYGTDGLFKTRLFGVAEEGFLKHVALMRYWREIAPDASTTTLPRKEGRVPGAKEAVAAEKAARGEADVVKVLQFSWERVL
jgi:hypothetical protein